MEEYQCMQPKQVHNSTCLKGMFLTICTLKFQCVCVCTLKASKDNKTKSRSHRGARWTPSFLLPKLVNDPICHILVPLLTSLMGLVLGCSLGLNLAFAWWQGCLIGLVPRSAVHILLIILESLGWTLAWSLVSLGWSLGSSLGLRLAGLKLLLICSPLNGNIERGWREP